MLPQLETTPFSTVRNWHLTIAGKYQGLPTHNLIIHPNGTLYGDLAQMGFSAWRMDGDQLVFQGRHQWDTWEFHPEGDGT